MDSGRDPAVHADRNHLMQARTRALASLQAACGPAHRAMLEQAIDDLDRRLADLAAVSASKTSR